MRLLPLSLYLVIWTTCLFGVLQLGRLDLGHSTCGPWGCGPATEALLAAHGFWVVVIGGALGLVASIASPARLRLIGLLMFAGGALGLVGMAVWEAVDWWPRVADRPERYLVRKSLPLLVTQVDLPIVQFTLAGLVCTWLGRGAESGKPKGESRHGEGNTPGGN